MSRSTRGLSLVIILSVVLATSGQIHGTTVGTTTIKGTVRFRGPVPPQQVVEVRRDAAFCGDTMTIQPLLVQAGSHGVKEAVVSLSAPAALPTTTPLPLTTIKNRKCAFFPRISAIMVDALLEIGNDDPVLHNTHIRSEGKTILNVAMVPQGETIRKQIRVSGVLNVKCDAHKFMQGYVKVFDHPYFTITDEEGRFQITGVPPGFQRITVWHETLGTLQKEVTVPTEGEISVQFDYS